MENKLRQLYILQLIDNSLDELEDLKGDLPHQVRALEEQRQGLLNSIEEHERTMRGAFAERDSADSEAVNMRDRLEKYRAQQFAVRNNKEYDALTREMDHAQEEIRRLERVMEAAENAATRLRDELGTMRTDRETLEALLEVRRRELTEVSRETEEEELRHTHERKKAVARIPKEDLALYERIRKARKGKAVVPVKRGACGGCFNRVPPQKLLELRQHKKVFTCERCGRILVSDEVVERASTVA